MKKITALLLALVLTLGCFAACGKEDPASVESGKEATPEPVAEQTPAPTEDPTQEPAEEPTPEPAEEPTPDGYRLEREPGTNQLSIYWTKDEIDFETSDMWIWYEGKDGQSYPMYPCDYGAVVVINVPENVEEVGFIVRTDVTDVGGTSWGSATKDVEEDRFVKMNGGDVSVFLKSGDETIYDSEEMSVGPASDPKPEDVLIGSWTVTNAFVKNGNNVTVINLIEETFYGIQILYVFHENGTADVITNGQGLDQPYTFSDNAIVIGEADASVDGTYYPEADKIVIMANDTRFILARTGSKAALPAERMPGSAPLDAAAEAIVGTWMLTKAYKNCTDVLAWENKNMWNKTSYIFNADGTAAWTTPEGTVLDGYTWAFVDNIVKLGMDGKVFEEFEYDGSVLRWYHYDPDEWDYIYEKIDKP